ncbi:MAG: helix-hairpin-helix domain-containing protein [Fusobacteriaceae bacterium]|nr:helix-hairpin-helix domain-containing protein [Fusobacteriaceae bacterium]MBN2838478.1 helix-hairpin-helix domain-containing protein [Fusobacteriaceae bacterium]
MKKVNHKILMSIVFFIVVISVYLLNRKEPDELELKKLTFNERVEEKEILENQVKLDKSEGKMDSQQEINDVNVIGLEEMINLGITKATAKKIIQYREEVEVIRNIEELGNIKGIGDKRLEKLKLILFVNGDNLGSQKKININEISSNKLTYYGFSKEEIKKIDKWKSEKGSVFSSVDLVEIVGEKRYDEIKNMITY